MPNIFGDHNDDLTVDDLVPRNTQVRVGMLPSRKKSELQLMPTKVEVAHSMMMLICQANGMKRTEADAISCKIRHHLRTAFRDTDSYKQLLELLGVDTKPDNS